MEFGQTEIHKILAVTDTLGIHREAVRIPLWNEGEGAVTLFPDGKGIEIVAPGEGDFDAWLNALRGHIQSLDLSRVLRAT